MFESYLLDYNVSSNVGNWRYVAGVGNDPREHRIFNVMKQGSQYDASTDYLLRWLPQLKALPTHQRYLVNKLTPQERIRIPYPDPIVGLPWQ
jgi:deoxyribodipyrimidine photo-lyase